ncbi:hypothetical protein CAL7716_100780 (plasmid) [Calothrix sp. PCC 7716]|nr:hypothetical protein CAL7716_100780 [Calothrix sp. PCC 7716]
MTVCNIFNEVCPKGEFKKTPGYQEILDKLKEGKNVYLQGAACTGKSTLANELQYDLNMRYVYVNIPRNVERSILYEVCESIATQLNFQVEAKCVSGVSSEGTLKAIKQLEERVLFVFDEGGNIQNYHPDAIKEINEWLYDLSMINNCQVVVASQTALNKSLPHFFANKTWRDVFDIVSLDDVITDDARVDINKAIECWVELELARGKYPKSVLKIISMGITGEIELYDAIRAVKAIY